MHIKDQIAPCTQKFRRNVYLIYSVNTTYVNHQTEVYVCSLQLFLWHR